MRRSAALLAATALAAMGAFGAASATGVETIATIAGTGAGATGPGTDRELATQSAVDHPRGLDVSAPGEVLIAEPFRHTVRRIDAGGRITRVAGTGVGGFSGDGGPATSAQLDGVHGVAFMSGGGFVLADTGNHRIRRVWPDGTITTVAGTGEPGYAGDGGPATAARIEAPRGVSALPDGGFLFPDSGNDRIRRVWPDGTITTVAGSGVRGYGGDGGPALAAQLNLPFGASSLPGGGFLIADAGNSRVRRVAADGTIVSVAEGLASPHAVAALRDGGFLVADTMSHRVLRVSTGGAATTVAGTGTAGYSGDGGPAASAMLRQPKALAVRADGSFLIGDSANNRVRSVILVPLPALKVKLTPPSIRSKAGRAATLLYVLSERAAARLTVLRNGKLVLGARQRSSGGPSRIVFGKGLKAGRYALRLVATTTDGRTARTSGSLRVRA